MVCQRELMGGEEAGTSGGHPEHQVTSAQRATTPHERPRDSRCEKIALRGLRSVLNKGASGFHYIHSFRKKKLSALPIWSTMSL